MLEYCLNLICHPAVHEKLLDVLLDSDDVEVFTSAQIHSHGMTKARLSAQEQVMGRSRSIHIQALLNAEALSNLLGRIQLEFASSEIRYWTSPVIAAGEFK
ncbi:DUF3240 family protein [Allopusillimonas ginsengisoli]|uniref:DUF3240 family protein n=1 Tax=Allopusillimonas ginsengisoli TaxID=453575 RepID=UPI0039C2C026